MYCSGLMSESSSWKKPPPEDNVEAGGFAAGGSAAPTGSTSVMNGRITRDDDHRVNRFCRKIFVILVWYRIQALVEVG